MRSIITKLTLGKVSYLVMEASSKVMRHDEEVVGAVGSVPIGPLGSNIMDGICHCVGHVVDQGEASVGELTIGVDRGVEPIGFVRVESADGGAREQEEVHVDLERKHARQTPHVSIDRIMVESRRQVIDIHLHPRSINLLPKCCHKE